MEMSTRIISQVWVTLLYELPLERLNGRTNLGNREEGRGKKPVIGFTYKSSMGG